MVHLLSLDFTPDGAQLVGARSPTSVVGTVLRHRHDLGLANGTVDRTIETDDYGWC